MKLIAGSFLILTSLIISFGSKDARVTMQEAQDRPEPCICKKPSGDIDCPGETRCQEGQWSSCRCDNKGQCVGECYPETRNALELASRVISRITDETVTPADLRRNKENYARILEDLLDSKARAGTYTVEYRGKVTSFGFSQSAVRLLNQAENELAR